jgi:DNA polymerase-3 subunit beta
MEFVVKKSDILRELAAVQSATERKTTIPILTNVLLKTDNGSLHIAATDLDCSLRTTCPAAIAKDGTITLPARKLYDYVGFPVMLRSGGAAHGSCVSQV